jgi:hypothetical protein
MLFPEAWQAHRLEQVISTLQSENPEAWEWAEQNGRLDSLMAWRLWVWGIDKKYWRMYRESHLQFELEKVAESSVATASLLVNELYRHHYNNTTFAPAITAAPLLSLRSPYHVIRPMRRLQLQCLSGSAVCAVLSAMALARLRVGSAATLVVATVDLNIISYNCYEARYGDLCADALFGSVSRACDTLHCTLKSFLGVTSLKDNPVYWMNRDINWRALLRDTFTERLFYQVGILITQWCFAHVLIRAFDSCIVVRIGQICSAGLQPVA